MTATVPLPNTRRAPLFDDQPEIPLLAGPDDLVSEYLRLVEERRAVEDRLAYVRAELELLAAESLGDTMPRGRFVSARGSVSARLQPTCSFDRQAVARELQRMGRLADVAVVQGPGLARFLAKEPAVAARLGHMVRPRKSIVLAALGA